MNDSYIIYALALATLFIVLAVGFWQMRRAGEAKRDHEHSAITEGKGPHGKA